RIVLFQGAVAGRRRGERVMQGRLPKLHHGPTRTARAPATTRRRLRATCVTSAPEPRECSHGRGSRPPPHPRPRPGPTASDPSRGSTSSSSLVAWFETLRAEDGARVGGKAASLGEM